jgi:hypothetical protein
LDFGSVVQGVKSTGSFTLTNSGNDVLTGLALAVTGVNPGDFTQTNTCGSSLAVAAKCIITVAFTPATAASETATLTLTGSQQNGPQAVLLSGKATAPTFSLNSPNTTAIIAAGGVSTYSIVLQADPGLTGQASLACSGLPAYANCSFAPSSIALATGGNSTLSVSTSQTQTASSWGERITTVLVCTLFLIPFSRKRLRVSLGLAAVFTGLIGGCAGSPSRGGQTLVNKTAPGSYAFTVSATSAATAKTETLTLVVQ